MKLRFCRCLIKTLIAMSVAAVSFAEPTSPQFPPEIKNLIIFPGDIKPNELIDTMKGFAKALGVRCTLCHVGEEGQPLSEFDFASDTKETKGIARQHLQMVKNINENVFLQKNSNPAKGAVTCNTCHHGKRKPEDK